jgi:hypothetical protein
LYCSPCRPTTATVSLHLCLSPYATKMLQNRQSLFLLYIWEKIFIWKLNTTSHWGYADPVCPMMTGPVCRVSNPNDRLESLPQPNRTYDLDPQIYRLLDSTHHFLNYINPL